MRAKATGLILWISLLGGIIFLAGEGGPDKALANGKDLSQSPVTLGDISEPAGSPGEAKIRQNLSYGNIPLYFVPNKGQVNEAARFYARASRYTLWLTADGLVFDRSVRKEKPDDRTRPREPGDAEGLREGMRGRNPRSGAVGAESSRGDGRAAGSFGNEDLRGESPGEDAIRPDSRRAESSLGQPMRAESLRRGADRGESRREVHRLVFMDANPEPEIDGDGGTGHTANYFIGSDPSKWQTNIATSRAAVYKELYPNNDHKLYGVEKQI